MPIVEGVAFPDDTPANLINALLWAADNEVRVRITWEGAIRSDGTLLKPGYLVKVGDSLKLLHFQERRADQPFDAPIRLDGITKVECTNKLDGDVLYDGVPFESVLATSLSLQKIARELEAQ